MGMEALTYGKHIAEEELSLYAVRSLALERNTEVQRHLDTCIQCRGRFAEAISGISLLTLTASPEAPASEATEFLLSRIKTEAARESFEENNQAETPVPWLARSRTLVKSLGWIAAAVALIFAIYFGSKKYLLERQVAALRGETTQLSGEFLRTQLVTNILNSHTAQRLTLSQPQAVSRPTAQILYDKTHAALIFLASHLDPIPANRTYMLWLVPVNGTQPVRIAHFRPDTEGNASIAMPPLSAGVDARTFGVTIEESQDSTIPTLPFVLSEE